MKNDYLHLYYTAKQRIESIYDKAAAGSPAAGNQQNKSDQLLLVALGLIKYYALYRNQSIY
jgi:hypothetical protein